MNDADELDEIIEKVGQAVDGHSGGMIALSLCTVLTVVAKDAGIPPIDVIRALIEMMNVEKDEIAH